MYYFVVKSYSRSHWYQNIKNCYISILKPKCAIPWHTDAEGEKFTSSFITSISTDKSFLEVDNIKYNIKMVTAIFLEQVLVIEC